MKIENSGFSYVGKDDDDYSVKEGSDIEKIKAFLEYHGYEYEQDSDNGITPFIRINFNDDGNVS